ncbi:alpha/beta hydrolase family protein [Cellulomonas sp. P5_C6]
MRTAVAVAVLALGLAGCAMSGDETATPAPSRVAASTRPADTPACLPDGTTAVTTGPQDDPTLVAFSGTGTKGVVLAPQSEGGPCQWAGELERLAGEGYLVATFAWSADDQASFLGAADVLRGLGAQDVALVGASKGGTYAAALADEVDPVAVVALGPPASFDGLNAMPASSDYTGPLLVIASTDDPNVAVSSSRAVSRNDDPSTFLEVNGRAHGVELFTSPHRAQVQDAIDALLATGFEG